MKTKKTSVRSVAKPVTKSVVKAVASKPPARTAVAKKPVTVAAAVKSVTPVAADAAPKAVAKVAAAPATKSTPTIKHNTPKSTAKAVSPIVRDSFTMTAADQELLKKCKRDAVTSGRDSTKKSEIVRAALRHFASLAASTQLMELNSLDPVKTGRPKKK